MKFLYSFFHMNLAYSAIPVGKYHEVLEKCYWPLLELIESSDVPLGIELPGYTLEEINKIDNSWVKKLQELISLGRCEPIACGYTQLIGPIVPYEVNVKNLEIGQACYSDLLGCVPTIAYVNEQALTSSLVDVYIDLGFKAIVMEWNNIAIDNDDFRDSYRTAPQLLLGTSGRAITVIWNDSVLFQKFQRLAHGEIDLAQYLDEVRFDDFPEGGFIPLYGNDTEIFDFRPGRYMTEVKIQSSGEWQNIRSLYEHFSENSRYEMVLPSALVDRSINTEKHKIPVSSARAPVRVKKQPKYNIVRWGASGVCDSQINSMCYYYLSRRDKGLDLDWKRLCYFWSSDFRTHIEPERWQTFYRELQSASLRPNESQVKIAPVDRNYPWRVNGNFVEFVGDRLRVMFDRSKGMSVTSFADLLVSDDSIFGQIKHGEIRDIRYSADFFSGHLVYEPCGAHKITDLVPVDVNFGRDEEDNPVVTSQFRWALGHLEKTWTVSDSEGTLRLNYVITITSSVLEGALRLGHVTAKSPSGFHHVKVSMGGRCPQILPIRSDIDHGRPLSLLISCSDALPISDGVIGCYDENGRGVKICVNMSRSAPLALLYNKILPRGRRLSRVIFTLFEMDDTSKLDLGGEKVWFEATYKADNINDE